MSHIKSISGGRGKQQVPKPESRKAWARLRHRKESRAAGVWSARVPAVGCLDSSLKTEGGPGRVRAGEGPIICIFKGSLWLLLRPCLERDKGQGVPTREEAMA